MIEKWYKNRIYSTMKIASAYSKNETVPFLRKNLSKNVGIINVSFEV